MNIINILNNNEILTKKEIKHLTKHIRNLNIFPHIKYKQIIVDGIYYPYIISSNGEVYALHYKGKHNNFHEIKIRYVKDGYCNVVLTYNKHSRTFLVHRLVAEAFIKNNDYNRIQINHKDGNKHKNSVKNLEWATPSENIRHAYKTNLAHSLCGEDSGLSKYTNDQIREVCSLLENNISFKKITEKTGVDRGVIYYVYNRKLWKSISKDYNFTGYSYGKSKDRINKIHKVCKLLEKNKHTIKEIESITGIPSYTIRDILHNKYYTEISHKYKIYKYNKMSKH